MKEMCAWVNKPSGINRHHPSGGAGAVYIDLLLTRLVQGGNSQVLHYKGRWISATDLLKSIFQYARVLAGIGIERGSVVALFAPNCPEALAIRYAANLLGAATTYLSAPFSAQRRMELLTKTDPALLILFPETRHAGSRLPTRSDAVRGFEELSRAGDFATEVADTRNTI
jgi:acyl-coenzyme A synthetase/AMP-(fatty) acid ligase